MSNIEPIRTLLNAVNAGGGNQTSDWFALNGVDQVQYSIEGTTPTVKFQHNQNWDSSANAPNASTWYDIETKSAAGVYATTTATTYGRFVVTAGNPVTVKARRLSSAADTIIC